MTETGTTRIRWEPTEYGGWTGCVGTLAPWAFQIYHPTPRDDRWILQAQLPGALGKYVTDPDDPDKLKAAAEHWLEEFAASLGAVFPADDDSAEWDDMEDEEAFRARNAPGRRVRFAHPDGGYPADQEMAAALLTPGDVYTIAWSDIGFSNTRLGLAGIKDHGQGFNSVLFEPVDDPGTAATAAREEEQ